MFLHLNEKGKLVGGRELKVGTNVEFNDIPAWGYENENIAVPVELSDSDYVPIENCDDCDSLTEDDILDAIDNGVGIVSRSRLSQADYSLEQWLIDIERLDEEEEQVETERLEVFAADSDEDFVSAAEEIENELDAVFAREDERQALIEDIAIENRLCGFRDTQRANRHRSYRGPQWAKHAHRCLDRNTIRREAFVPVERERTEREIIATLSRQAEAVLDALQWQSKIRRLDVQTQAECDYPFINGRSDTYESNESTEPVWGRPTRFWDDDLFDPTAWDDADDRYIYFDSDDDVDNWDDDADNDPIYDCSDDWYDDVDDWDDLDDYVDPAWVGYEDRDTLDEYLDRYIVAEELPNPIDVVEAKHDVEIVVERLAQKFARWCGKGQNRRHDLHRTYRGPQFAKKAGCRLTRESIRFIEPAPSSN